MGEKYCSIDSLNVSTSSINEFFTSEINIGGIIFQKFLFFDATFLTLFFKDDK